MPPLTLLGLGEYLHSINPQKTWIEHLQHMLILCTVHIQRNFRKRFPTHALLYQLDHLWASPTEQDYLDGVLRICTAYPELKSWFRNKRSGWIIAGLVASCSKIPFATRALVSKNT